MFKGRRLRRRLRVRLSLSLSPRPCECQLCQRPITARLFTSQVNRTLTELDVSCNGLGDAGAAHLAAMLQGNTALTAVDLSENGLSEAAREELKRAWGGRDPARLRCEQ